MVKVYYSHLGEDELKQVIEGEEEYNFDGELMSLIEEINSRHPGLKNLVVDRDGKILSSVRVYKNVLAEADKILDQDGTRLVRDVREKIANDENVLFSIYNARNLTKLFEATLKEPHIDLEHRAPKMSESAMPEYKKYLDEIDGPIEERIKKFETGKCSLRDLQIPNGESIDIKINKGTNVDIFDLFDRTSSKLLPESLINAIMNIWDLDSPDSKLYLHQEDALFYVLGKKLKPTDVPGEALLLSLPTGGGKTEAFLIPLIAYIYNEKNEDILHERKPEVRTKSIIVYPTKALANDQVNRIVEILYEVNKDSTPYQEITVGILTGDTPARAFGGWKIKESPLVQLCPHCQSSNLDYPEYELQDGVRISGIKCKSCGSELTFVRLTREDILRSPPDILITNLDEINYCLQAPKFRPLFKQKIDIMIFDEIHQCESVFGCHTGHLLRRLEATSGHKPLYVGVSATIKNAEELASLIFDVNKGEVLYLSEKNRPYLKNETSQYRYHYVLTPYEWDEERYMQTVTATLNTVDVLGHAIRDPHFRKTLVFSNYRQDTDNLVKYLRDQEDRYFTAYRDGISQKLSTGEKIEGIELEIMKAVGGWYEYLKSVGSLYDSALGVGWHRGGLEQKERLKAVTLFSSSRKIVWGDDYLSPVDTMMATKTLELGIDIGDVSNVFNCSAPFTVNEYVQRAGRGGRRNDSTAITVIDPTNPLDFYFKKHILEYAEPEKREFEDAPIIITNESIVKVHIYARILEFIADSLGYKEIIKVEDLKNAETIYNGSKISFMNDPKQFAEAIFENMLNERAIADVSGVEKTAFDRYVCWLEKEHEILNVTEIKINAEKIKDLLINKCHELRDRIINEDLKITEELSGLKAKDTSLVPRMRGSGAVCRINLRREGRSETKDHVSRRRALTNMPPGGFATQGANTFRVEKIDRDSFTEAVIRDQLSKNNEAVEFFKKQFGEHFPKNMNYLDLQTPKDLDVQYFPYRFYCPQCGRTYTELTSDERCTKCFTELRQLTEIYLCENKDCGEIFEPPVPKVCINPEHLREEKEFIQSLKSGHPDYDTFRFRALPNLHWQCRKCKVVFNFHQKWSVDPRLKAFINLPFDMVSFDTPEGIAKHYQYRPESIIRNKQNYLGKRLNPARYSCEKCNKYNTIKAKNVPTVRSALLEYIIKKENITDPEELETGSLEFSYVDAIALSREYTMTYYPKDAKEPEIKRSDTFPGNSNSFLANMYSTHAVYLNLNESVIDRFILSQTPCLQNNCANCELIGKIPDNELIGPLLTLKNWEKNKTPDVRRKWCGLARGGECKNEECESCPQFLRREHLKYLLLHTLKHALILAMPKYTGINKNEVHGIIYPNDNTNTQLVFLDVYEGGSGSVYLIKRNWKHIWELSKELMINASEGKGNLLLSHFCERHNHDLCPVLGMNFYKFAEENGLEYNA